MNVLDSTDNFLGISEQEFFNYHSCKCVIQQLPYEFTSSYKKGSDKGPQAVIRNSQYVEYYDIELETETYKKCGIATLPALDFGNSVNKDAMDLISQATTEHIQNDKFVVSIGAEHTVTYGLFKSFQEKWPDIGILQLDAHSDLRLSYEDNIWSHASVMARIHELNAPSIHQVGIRAQCIEEAELIKSSPNIHTYYAHEMWDNEEWIDELVDKLPSKLYITVDTDGFDPSIAPSVGTAEPGGLQWYPTLKLLKKVFAKCDVKGFDIVELNPKSDDDVTAYNMAQLCYKMIGYKFL